MKTVWTFLGILFLVSFTPARAQEEVSATPLLVLVESLPWMHPGEEQTIWDAGYMNPAFVLYEDGKVIFKRGTDQFQLYTVTLSPDDANAFLKQFDLELFQTLEDFYSASRQLDQPVYLITYNRVGNPKTVRVFGQIRDNEEDRRNTPEAFLKAFDAMIAFDRKAAGAYDPEWVDVRVIPYTDAKGEPVQWPASWPDIYHPTTRNVTETFGHEAFRLSLPGGKKGELEKLLAGLKDKQAVLISERKWYLSPERFRLPGEELWITP